MTSSVSSRVLAAFASSDQGYLGKALAQRQPGEGGAGSRFLEPMTLEQIRGAVWEEYTHPQVSAPAVAFKAAIPGRFGLVRLDSLDPESEVTLDDRKGVGQVMPVVKGALGPQVPFTVLLLGPAGKEDSTEVVWTFFPGEPISPSQVSASGDTAHGAKITAAQAIALGLEWAKIE